MDVLQQETSFSSPVTSQKGAHLASPNQLANRGGNVTIGFGSSSPSRPPASHSKSFKSINSTPCTKRPSSIASSRQSSSNSIRSACTASTSPPSSSSESEEEDLIQLVYTSAARSRSISVDEIRTILAGSRERNANKNITGLLLYRDGSFVQFLEGPAEAVDALYDHIERDSRHRNLIRVLRQPIAKRDFSQWSMAFRDLEMVKARQLTAPIAEVELTGDDVDKAQEGFSQLMNVGLKVGDHTDLDYRPSSFGNAKLDLPNDMSRSMRTMIITFYKLLDRSL